MADNNLLGGIIGGLASLFGGSGGGPGTQAARTSHGVETGYWQTWPARQELDTLAEAYRIARSGRGLESILWGQQGYDITKPVPWLYNDKGRPQYNAWIRGSVPESPGLVGQISRLAPEIQGLYLEGAERGMAGTMDLLNRYLPEAQALYDVSYPELAGLRRSLGQTASQNLALGSRLAPADAYRLTQQVRSDWANRGLGASAPAQLAEALSLYGGGEALRRSRVQEAANIYDLLAQTRPDYVGLLTRLGGDPVGQSMTLIGSQQPYAYTPVGFDPFNGAFSSVSAQALRNQYQQQADRASAWGNIIGGIGGILGGGF